MTAKQIDRACNYYGGLLHHAELHQAQPPTIGRVQKSPPALETAKDKPKPKPGIKISSSFDHLKSLSRPGTNTSSDVLYVMMDGSYLQFRNQNNSHKDTWKEIKIGRVFFASHQVKEVSKNRNIIRYSGYVVSVGNVKPFFEKMEARLDDYGGTMEGMENMLNKDQVEKVIEANEKIRKTDKSVNGENREKLHALLP